ncbi:MXAN_6230/SCO0854 family RING domain-containing protein [Streptomyces justiciae]|uniref:MXAN_6230/SCO0854 family RING domain-containing protein n=1 Tax=Streptomyces justiciae TaxID=2780140 RepID=A0ABU3M6L2_9ACTN|nr:MXAN_6230/SCO0854 family RING domain-containing protein [Streptomyces justiciae]MDT7847154.1 MXAN_6230/SCO0854 family RING domain-containing protein [Streptomyces justiciae]
MSVLSSVLLRRLRTVYVDQAGPRPGDPSTAPGLVALEAELLDRGFAPTAELHAALAWLGPAGLADAGKQLIRHVDAELGADRTHMPMFRSFPASVPDDTFQLFVDRVFTLLLQWPKQPCVLCGTVGSVHPVSPCAHLVCRECWDGADYAGCPICHRRIDRDDPFLRPAPPRHAREVAVGPLKLLALGKDARADAVRALLRLLARRTPLPPQDRDDVKILLAHAPRDLGWLPEDIPVRQTKALALGMLLLDRHTRVAATELLDAQLTTATDVLRLLCVWSGGDGDLLEPPRMRSLPRALRRRLLGILDGLAMPALVEDVLRHPGPWKRAAEILHPYEQHARHPKAALAFAVLRATDVSEGPLGEALLRTAAEHPDAVRVTHRDAVRTTAQHPDGVRMPQHDVVRADAEQPTGAQANARHLAEGGTDSEQPAAARTLAEHSAEARTADDHPAEAQTAGTLVKPATWAARVEQALYEKDFQAALDLLAQRPGELLRRLDHLLRLRELDVLPDGFGDTLRRVLPKAGPGPLLAVLGRMRIRHLPGGRRVFFPRGQVTRSFTIDDTRVPLSPKVTEAVCDLLEAEALRRLGLHDEPRLDLSVLDSALTGLAVPAAETAASKALVTVPRGSTQPLPEGEVLRLFLHWMEPAKQRVDLDLSVALYDAEWDFAGLCDYTNLVHEGRSAVHSGDLVSAPAPDGATEYVDLDLAALAERGVRYALPVVFSFNDIAFDELLDAFAGFMALPSAAEEDRNASYDPRTVRQRYDLVGDSRIHVPMLVDLDRRTFLWTDLHLPADEGFHSLYRHGADLGRVAQDLHQYFASGRTTLWDLAVWRAAARGDEVAVIRRAPHPRALDELWRYRRHEGEPDTAFAARVRDLEPPEARQPSETADALAGEAASHRHVFLALVHGGVAPEGATGSAYRLLPGPVDGCGLEALAAGDLVAALG